MKIKLPMPFAAIVAGILHDKYGYPCRNLQHFDDTFTQEELSKITELRFDAGYGPNCCNGVHLLPNLKKLTITHNQSMHYTRPEEVRTINLKSLESIQCCKKLESLTIENQRDLLSIDVSQMPALKELNISNNPRLQKICGLAKLKQLNSFVCYGNDQLFKIENLDKIIEKRKELNLQHVDLDVLLFPSAIGYDSKTRHGNLKALAELKQLHQNRHCIWTQNCISTYYLKSSIPPQLVHTLQLNLQGMITLHNAACQILEENVDPNSSIGDKIVAIDNYLAKNVAYDINRIEAKKIKRDPNGRRDNSAYNCLVGKRCVCEGFSRGMQYLLALMGIKSHTVHNWAEPDATNLHDSNSKIDPTLQILPYVPYNESQLHSILCIDDFYGAYCDPCWDRGRYKAGDQTLPYCLLSLAQISKDHQLSILERGHDGAHIKRGRIAQSIKDNGLFIKTKSDQVEAQRRRLGREPPVRGTISLGRI